VAGTCHASPVPSSRISLEVAGLPVEAERLKAAGVRFRDEIVHGVGDGPGLPFADGRLGGRLAHDYSSPPSRRAADWAASRGAAGAAGT
jgi:hypothetical protein